MNKIVIVAGGCGRIGTAFVKSIIACGGLCVIADINEIHGLELVKQFDETNKVIFVKTDLTNKKSIANLISTTVNDFSRIDAYVNTSYPRNRNWGVKFADVEFADFCENANIHLGGYFLSAQQMCEFFKTQGYGNIVQVASIQGISAPKFDTYHGILVNGKEMTSPAEYSVFKAGIIHFSRYLAKYYQGSNIRSNCISPGGILEGQPEQFLKRYNNYCTSKGMLDPEDIAGTLIYLLSDMSLYVNGQNIVVDDGWSL